MFARTLESRFRTLVGTFPAVFLTGPRQSGKTTLARTSFPDFHYVSLEDLQNRQEVVEDPRGFLRRLEGRKGVILDEVHHGQPAPLSFWRDAAGHEVDALLDLGTRRIPVEIKAGQTLAGDVFRGLDYYLGLAGGGTGVLIYGGDESHERRNHLVRSWWHCG